MKPKDLVKHFGSQSEAARFLGVTRAIVSYWEKQNRIPPKTQAWIQLCTNGKLKAENMTRKVA